MPGLLGKKIGMTSVFSAEGKNLPCTVIEVGPCVVTQIKTIEKDGYEAVQIGFEDKKEKHTTQPEMGHFKKAGVTPKRYLAEFKNFETAYNLCFLFSVAVSYGIIVALNCYVGNLFALRTQNLTIMCEKKIGRASCRERV